jgi:hypothetical protein
MLFAEKRMERLPLEMGQRFPAKILMVHVQAVHGIVQEIFLKHN